MTHLFHLFRKKYFFFFHVPFHSTMAVIHFNSNGGLQISFQSRFGW